MVRSSQKRILITWIFLSSINIHTLSQNYIFNAAELQMSNAEALCAFSYGTHLASIHSSSQNDEAKSICPSTGPECWIGATDAATENIWVWTDGIYVCFPHFATTLTLPNNSQEHHLIMEVTYQAVFIHGII